MRTKDRLKPANFNVLDFKCSVLPKDRSYCSCRFCLKDKKLYTSSLWLPPMGLYISQRFVFLEGFLHPVGDF